MSGREKEGGIPHHQCTIDKRDYGETKNEEEIATSFPLTFFFFSSYFLFLFYLLLLFTFYFFTF